MSRLYEKREEKGSARDDERALVLGDVFFAQGHFIENMKFECFLSGLRYDD